MAERLTVKIKIDAKKLTDSPWSPKARSKFIFNQDDTRDFINDLTTCSPTCYLVTGYRGAGKSSFVKKVQESLSDKKTIFVYSSFAKYQSHSFLLRKLIRGLYQSLSEKRNADLFENLKAAESKLPVDDRLCILLETLYDKTFNDTTQSTLNQVKKQRELKIEWNVLLFIIFLLTGLLSLSNLIRPWVGHSTPLITVIATVLSVFGCMNKFSGIKKAWTKTISYNIDFARKSLYDDEIADFYFTKILQGLSSRSLKIVFVLDELDKVNPEETEKLLNEMKPYLVSGLANFIVIAGQEMFHKYKKADTTDDAVISSLFSRTLHVPLLTLIDFDDIFQSVLRESEDLKSLKPYIDFLVFKSKRVPRKFINLIRQSLLWEDKMNPCIIVDPNDSRYHSYSSIVRVIDEIDESKIVPSFYSGARDYLNMQLFIVAELIFTRGIDGHSFTFEDLMPTEPENDLVNGLESYLRGYGKDLLQQLIELKIIGLTKNLENPVIPAYELVSIQNSASDSKSELKSENPVLDSAFNDFRNVLAVVHQNVESPNKATSGQNLQSMVMRFHEMGAFKADWGKEGLLRNFLEKPDDVMKADDTRQKTTQLLLDNKINFVQLVSQALEFFTQTLLQKEKGYSIVKKEPGDFTVEKLYSNINLLVEIKFRKTEYSVRELIQKSVDLVRTESESNLQKQILLVVYTYAELGEIERNQFRFTQMMDEGYKPYQKVIHFIQVSMNHLQSARSLLDNELPQIFPSKTDRHSFIGHSVSTEHPFIDDDYYPHILQLQEYNYLIEFQVGLQIKYWRFGIHFSRDNFFPAPEIRYQEKIPLIHLAKEPNDEMRVTYYNEKSERELDINVLGGHYHGEKLVFVLITKHNQTSVNIIDGNGISILQQPLLLEGFSFAKILAWADNNNPFEINADIIAMK